MFARFVLVIALLCFVGCAVSDCVMNTTLPYRLPQTMRPQHYNIAIQLNEVVMPYSISGSSQIRISVELPTSCIVLHSANGNISNVSFVTNDSSTIQPTSISSVPEKQWFVISFSNNLPIGVGTLSLQFNGWLNTNNATGFFVSPLEVLPPTTQERPDDIESFLIETLGENWQTDGPVMFATQFEGPYARMAFPCFDEPSFKATFQVSLSIPSDSGMIALSNTPLMQQTAKNSYSVYQFEATPVPISCYLIAFAIGDFDYISTESRGIEYRIYTAPGKSSYGEFALNITVELMNYWADLWDFNYPFPKLDQISVPRIVQDGMENIGLITYWPGFLFPVPSTTAHYQKNCMVISHELSHLWFGDTVTLPWWSETYNNEGFARYLQYTGCHAIFPEWNTWEDGSFNYFSFAYSIIKQDSLGTLRPEIVLPREVSGTVSSVSNAFAGPTYPKGASLNRMFNIYMGDSNWNGALGYHLHKYQFTNPTTGDLLDSFDEYTNHTMDYKSKFMPWLTLSGFPIVTLDFDATRETLYVSQYPCSRYLPPRGQEYKWFITLPLSINGTLDSFIYVDFYNYSTKLHLPSLYPEFVQGNANHTSYFVVNYATLDQWYPVLQSMANSEYDEVLRNLLIQDVFILTQMSHQTIDLPLNLTSTWEKVNVNSLWSTLLPLWFEITVALDEQEYYPSLTEMLVTMLSSTVQNLPASGEPSYSSTVLFYDTFYGDSTMISNLLAKFRAGTPFTFAEQKAGYWAVGRYGTSAEFNQLLSMYSTASNSIQAQDILLGVTGPQNLQLCNTALVYFDDNLAIEDRLPAARNMLAYNSYCRSLAWDYIRVTGYQLFEAVGTSGASTFLNSFSGLLSTPEYLREATVYLEEMVSMGYLTEEQAQNAAVTIAINVDIVKTNTNWSSA